MNWKKIAVAVTREVYSLGSLALIGWGIFRFLGGIYGTTDVQKSDVILGIPWLPYFAGYADGNLYIGARPFGTLFFPFVELLSGLPIPVIWPAILGVCLLWVKTHRGDLKSLVLQPTQRLDGLSKENQRQKTAISLPSPKGFVQSIRYALGTLDSRFYHSMSDEFMKWAGISFFGGFIVSGYIIVSGNLSLTPHIWIYVPVVIFAILSKIASERAEQAEDEEWEEKVEKENGRPYTLEEYPHMIGKKRG